MHIFLVIVANGEDAKIESICNSLKVKQYTHDVDMINMGERLTLAELNRFRYG